MMMKIRIHHFFDMIRDFGIGKEILPHPNLHSYHQVARIILENPGTELKLVVGADAVCQNCTHLKNGACTDSITHHTDFTEKEAFNNHLDRKIQEACQIDTSQKYTPEKLLAFARIYLDQMKTIYEGNADWHTQQRKENVKKGLEFYSGKHRLHF